MQVNNKEKALSWVWVNSGFIFIVKLDWDWMKKCIWLLNLKPDLDLMKPVIWHHCLFTTDYYVVYC